MQINETASRNQSYFSC